MQGILFDLDGTLLPMDMDVFTKGYFSFLVKKAVPRGYAPEALVNGVLVGTEAMVRNDGSMRNKERFWQTFASLFGQRVYEDVALFDEFYTNEFKAAVRFTNPAPQKAQRAVKAARTVAEKVILATNPIFPLAGVATRLNWLGFDVSDFDYVTSYENTSFCKPNTRYYESLLCACGLRGEDCLMVGNDVQEDVLPARAAGLQTYLVADCAINRDNTEIPGGSGAFDELIEMLSTL